MQQTLAQTYGLSHTTLQVDHVEHDLLKIGGAAATAQTPHCAEPDGVAHRTDTQQG